MLTLEQVLKSIADRKSLNLFRNIALRPDGILSSKLCLSELQLSRKEYYSRLLRMQEAELIEKINGRYTLTSYGKIVNEYNQIIQNTLVREYYKLKAIDTFEKSKDVETAQRAEIIDSLIDDDRLKSILVG